MFDFNPVINKSDIFWELFLEAFVWSFWFHPMLWLHVFLSIFFSKYITVFFHRKTIAYSLMFFIPIFMLLLSLLAVFFEDRPSNYLLYGTIYSVPIVAFCVIMFIQSSRYSKCPKLFKNKSQNQTENFGDKFQALSIRLQIVLLMLVFILIFSFNMLFSIAIWRYYFFLIVLMIFIIYVLVLFKKIKKMKGIKMPFKSSDFIPVLLIIICSTLISFVNIGDFVCLIPMFNCYFSCRLCQ